MQVDIPTPLKSTIHDLCLSCETNINRSKGFEREMLLILVMPIMSLFKSVMYNQRKSTEQ